jgi:hypothetical protein
MPRLSTTARERNEAAIRDAMNRLLAGQVPPGGGCDLKTLAAEAGVTRTGFYPKNNRPGPYQHLADEFHRRLRQLQAEGTTPDPRTAQIARLKTDNATLQTRLAVALAEIDDLTAFKNLALSRLAAQHEEITRLRPQVSLCSPPDNVRRLVPARERVGQRSHPSPIATPEGNSR